MINLTQSEFQKIIDECIIEERQKIFNWLRHGYPIDHIKSGFCMCFACGKMERETMRLSAKAIEAKNIKVHYCDWAQTPEIRILCDQSYDNPDLSEPSPGVYGRYDKKLYTFDAFRVNCTDCLVKIK